MSSIVAIWLNTYSTDTSHGVMDSAGSETALDNLKAFALAQDDILNRYANVVEADVAVAVGCVVVAKDTQHAVDCNAGGVCRDQDD